jgi:hypothetical protein
VSAPHAHAAGGRSTALPSWLAPRDGEQLGTGRTRLIETTLLVLVAVLLATATIADVARQAGVNHRLIADQHTWRVYTHHDFRNLGISQELLGATSTQREVVCGNTSAGPPKSTTQLCLAIWGPTVHGLREVHGGWYLPPYVEDVSASRYGCFGTAARGLCPR